MKFKINVEQFFKAFKPAADIALKNIKKYDDGEDFRCAGLVTIEAFADALLLKAYGGAASITVRVTRKGGYVPDKSGKRTVPALELFSSLKSFSPKDSLIVTAENEQMRFALESGQEVFIAVPAISNAIECPKVPKEFIEETLVDRDCLVKGMKKVAYAMSDDKKCSYLYDCMLLETWKNRIRFTAGSGGRFAIIEFESDGQLVASGETRMIFPRINVYNIIRIFKDTSHSTVRVKYANSNPKAKTFQQIVIENDSIVMAIYDLEYFIAYHSMDVILDHNYSYQITTNIEDWKYAFKAIAATYHSHDNNTRHNTKVTADLLRGCFHVKTKAEVQMNRKIDFELGTFVIDHTKGKDHNPWFCCESNYIRDMVNHGGKNEVIVINFEDQAKLDDITDDRRKKMEPVLIKYPEKVYKDGVRGKYFMFYTVSLK